MSLDVRVTTSGVIANGHAPRIIDEWLAEASDSVARQGLSQVHLLMDQAFRNPTPYYETQVTWDRAGADRVIHDRGIIYGPWLESGWSATRFRGYAHWRRTRQHLVDSEVPRIVDRLMPDLIQRLSR